MAGVKDFYLGARPKTLSAAFAPVSIGVSLAWLDQISISVSIACLTVAIALQVGVNYANDYSDGIKGTDKDRVGPMRLVGSGKASPRSVLSAMFVAFFVACIAGIYVASQSSWWLIAVGLACVVLAWFYTGSSKPYGYFGLGELVVFICFGLVATIGTFYANTLLITSEIIIASVIPGMFSVAVLLANNIRDEANDKIANKKTLAVRIGEKNAKTVFYLTLIIVLCCIIALGAMITEVFFTLILAPLLLVLALKMQRASEPKSYIEILGIASLLNLLFSISISIAVLISG